jgi:hypothetical protein
MVFLNTEDISDNVGATTVGRTAQHALIWVQNLSDVFIGSTLVVFVGTGRSFFKSSFSPFHQSMEFYHSLGIVDALSAFFMFE